VMTFKKILTNDTTKIIHWSNIHLAHDLKTLNLPQSASEWWWEVQAYYQVLAWISGSWGGSVLTHCC
jgi:hypothetical protein